VCDRPTVNGKTHDVCANLQPHALDGFVALAQYEQPISDLIHMLKYSGVRDSSRSVYTVVRDHWPKWVPRCDFLVPIPIHPKKKLQRGYNQAAVIAREIAKVYKVPIHERMIIKALETSPQAAVRTRDERRARNELQQSFQCVARSAVQNAVIGLVDDVATTRSTLNAACSVLKLAGAKQVWGMVLAHKY
jgi:predicted amidophosphoribosyltransferase